MKLQIKCLDVCEWLGEKVKTKGGALPFPAAR